MRWIGLAALAAVAWCQIVPAAVAQGRNLGPKPPGQFDFYQLSLTWVPSFCAHHDDSAECGQNLGFALHGLWPQSTNGYPSDCSGDALQPDQRAANAGLFASPSLIDHEWTTHGTCSGLGAAGYFDLIRRVRQAVAVPPFYQREAPLAPHDQPALISAFLQANPGLTAGSLVLACSGRQVAELHVCLTKDGSPRSCVAWERTEGNCR